MLITCRAPVRIDFAGAWTDVSYFADAFGGATLNAAIALHVSGSIETRESAANGLTGKPLEVSGPSGKHIAQPTDGLRVSYGSAVPAGSGLGTSAALNVVWLALARRESVTSEDDKMRIAALAYDIERTLGIIGGKQDQYASAVGGVNLFEFNADVVRRTPVCLPPAQLADLESLLLLCYTGTTRLSSTIHRDVWRNFREGRKDTVQALFDLRDSAHEAKAALETGDLELLSRIVTSQRRWMKCLDPSTSNEAIEELFEITAADTMGAKACGAGGGGCVFFIAKSTKAKERISEALRSRGLDAIDIAFDFEGLVLQTG